MKNKDFSKVQILIHKGYVVLPAVLINLPSIVNITLCFVLLDVIIFLCFNSIDNHTFSICTIFLLITLLTLLEIKVNRTIIKIVKLKVKVTV
ncbi:hypothetical protein CWO05_19900 [Vibrio splendidus]|nr:hypothetical protein CWO05_19900 [Vibrio splendidus]